MLLFVFGFVGGAVVINSAVLVSLSVLLLVHYSVSSAGVPALPSLPSVPRPRYSPLSLFVWMCVSASVCPRRPGVALASDGGSRSAERRLQHLAVVIWMTSLRSSSVAAG